MEVKDNTTQESAFHDNLVKNGGRKEQRYYTYESMSDVLKCQERFWGGLENKNILDYGCGIGHLSVAALKKGANVFSIDISEESIEKTKESVDSHHLSENHQAKVMDCQNLEFDDNSFDVVIGSGILHHLPDFHKALLEIKRVLKADGYAVFYEPLGYNPLIRLYRKLTPHSRTEGEHPLSMNEFKILKKDFPQSIFYFFDFLSILSKIFIVLKQPKLAEKVLSFLRKIDRKILGEEQEKIGFFQKMSWIAVIKLKY